MTEHDVRYDVQNLLIAKKKRVKFKYVGLTNSLVNSSYFYSESGCIYLDIRLARNSSEFSGKALIFYYISSSTVHNQL